ncbi:hypothetical protein BEL15_24020 [Salmonella enterica]|nr:hypothetical protein [Salmonella enterica]
MRDRRYSASSLTDSLRSVVRLRRAVWAYKLGGNFLEDARAILSKEEARPRRCRFSIGSAPLTSITKSDAQISGGETRQDYKDTRRFPLAAPSCALLFLPFGLPVSFRCYGRVCLIPRLTLSSG